MIKETMMYGSSLWVSTSVDNLNKGLVKKYRGGGGWGVGWSREGVGHELLSLVQGVGRAVFSYP